MPLQMRDQERARKAYQLVGEINASGRDNYKIVVNSLGANIMRMGLSAALADLQRRGDKGGNDLLSHLAQAEIPALGNTDAGSLPERVRALEAQDYMLATREILAFASWLKRAVQAKFDQGGDDAQ